MTDHLQPGGWHGCKGGNAHLMQSGVVQLDAGLETKVVQKSGTKGNSPNVATRKPDVAGQVSVVQGCTPPHENE